MVMQIFCDPNEVKGFLFGPEEDHPFRLRSLLILTRTRNRFLRMRIQGRGGIWIRIRHRCFRRNWIWIGRNRFWSQGRNRVWIGRNRIWSQGRNRWLRGNRIRI
uniref:(northern house mosquito) hypothetical protein n=1 Tax=Culex pipiens TaxID=7175 RepID=A0A8D8AL24_CULPI